MLALACLGEDPAHFEDIGLQKKTVTTLPSTPHLPAAPPNNYETSLTWFAKDGRAASKASLKTQENPPTPRSLNSLASHHLPFSKSFSFYPDQSVTSGSCWVSQETGNRTENKQPASSKFSALPSSGWISRKSLLPTAPWKLNPEPLFCSTQELSTSCLHTLAVPCLVSVWRALPRLSF